MTSILKTFFALTFVIVLLDISASACTCSYAEIKAKGFSGQVFAADEKILPNYKEPLPKATLKLLRRTDDEDQVIAEIVADENGRFSLENVKSGKYLLQVGAMNFQNVFVPIKIVKGSSRKKDEIFISLAPALTCCEGVAKVQKAK